MANNTKSSKMMKVVYFDETAATDYITIPVSYTHLIRKRNLYSYHSDQQRRRKDYPCRKRDYDC